ncbi:rna recognition motif-containing protein, partial [Cystoisospora suis]
MEKDDPTIKVGRPTAVGSSGGQQLQRPLIMPNISPLGGLATTPTAGVAGALNAAAALGGGGAAAVGTPGMMLAGGGGGVSPGVLGAAAAGGAGHSSSMFNSAQAGAAAATAILAGRTGAVAENLAGLLSTSQGSVLSPDQQLLQQQLLQQQQQQVNNRVYIGNVPFGFSSEDLKKIFVVFGPILSCQLLPSQENPQQHRGYGFIEYATADAAKLAIETMNGFEV